MAKEIRDPSLPSEHLGQIPAGHQRDEENRRRTDSLAEQADATGGDAGGLNPDALKVDNEIAQYFDPVTGDTPVSNKQSGRYYVWVHADQVTISSFMSRGYTAVQGKDKEAEEHRGQHKAAGGTLRGFGDTLLYWCPVALREREEERSMRLAIAMGAVEKNWAEEANSGPLGRSFGPLAHGDPNDPKLRSTVLRGTNGEVATLMDDLKRGNPIGNFRPGDDVRR